MTELNSHSWGMNPMTTRIHARSPSRSHLSLGMQGIPRWGVIFPKVFRHFVYSPCNLLVKPSLLVACIAPHQCLLGAAISPPGCIPGRYAPKTQLLLKIGSGISPFQFCASWRTSSDNSCYPVPFPGFLNYELPVPQRAGRTNRIPKASGFLSTACVHRSRV